MLEAPGAAQLFVGEELIIDRSAGLPEEESREHRSGTWQPRYSNPSGRWNQESFGCRGGRQIGQAA